MKSSRSTKSKRLIISPEGKPRIITTLCNSEKPIISCSITGHKQANADPFREVAKGTTHCKLKPILIKKKLSPSNSRSLNAISIKIPDLSEDGKFRHNRFVLPAINRQIEEGTKKSRVIIFEEFKNSLPHVMSDGVLQTVKHRKPDLTFKNAKKKELTELEISFGYDRESPILTSRNPFKG
ncbi:hypothetical protein SteCoe_9856 [Stentor coeruleus]|uniref:Uncharacterized protein n=1 Tax=Stentor coeruleus TaxID=5963 RepID=A0A1R2CGW5_9CILI|nr:hypothetical protein SteCoe_9856 [Stentor coeruleus]